MHMLSSTPAKQLNVFDERGSIVPGKVADLVVLDDMLRVVMTVCRGKVAYSSKTIDKYRVVSV
jgi:N-acetylglucosamine-6-phosphate deacetylase